MTEDKNELRTTFVKEKDETMIIVAFDIGIKNLAWAQVHYKKLCPSLLRPNTENRTVQEKRMIDDDLQKELIEYMNVLHFDVQDMSGHTMTHVYRNIHDYLRQRNQLWQKTDVVLIEQQMSARHKCNIKALKISQHIFAFFLLEYPSVRVLEYMAKYKTQYFGFYSPVKHERKKWAVVKATELIEKDPVISDLFSTFKKKDDISDCLLMTFVYFFSTVYGKTKKRISLSP